MEKSVEMALTAAHCLILPLLILDGYFFWFWQGQQGTTNGMKIKKFCIVHAGLAI